VTAGAGVVTVAALQTSLTDDVATNVARVAELVREAAGRGAQVILPSELFEGHYFCRTQHEVDFRRAHPVAGHPTLGAMSALARELGVVIPVSFFERAGNAAYNSLAVVDADGAVLGTYRKSHIPAGPGYNEKFFFRAGDTGFKTFDTRFGRIGVGICWDQWFPEAARAMVLDGADLLFYPTAIGSEPEEPTLDTRKPWRRVMVGHAVANACAVTAANRVGTEGELGFYGTSFICDARGEILAELDDGHEGVITAPIDLTAQRVYRDGMGFFRDRRPELYGRLLEP
jgi:N-carbamoylputrescine amidase